MTCPSTQQLLSSQVHYTEKASAYIHHLTYHYFTFVVVTV